jgi:hypothetical protein
VYQALKKRLVSEEFKKTYRTSPHFFTRNRVFSFSTMILIILNNISKSLSVELAKFFQRMKFGCLVSKQAFSKSRYKISPEAFVDLNETFVRAYYSQGAYQLYAGKWLLVGSDGSDYELPWEEKLRKVFGVADNGQAHQPMCMAKGVKIWDLLNRLTICATLGHYDIAEIRHFKTAWQKAQPLLEAAAGARVLLLGDMHYPSLWLMAQLQMEGKDFLFRCKPDFCREIVAFMKSGKKQAHIYMPIATDRDRKRKYKNSTGQTAEQVPQGVWVRALNFTRPNGERSCLVTSIAAEELGYDEVCKLYPYRWGEEVSFYFDKNRTQIENFSAKLPEGIRQEWFANVLTSNLAQLLIEDAQQILDQEQENTPNKHKYQINRSVAVGIIKDELPGMLFGKEKAETFYERMLKIIIRHREPIRPGRSFPRKRKHRLKFSMNLRRVV